MSRRTETSLVLLAAWFLTMPLCAQGSSYAMAREAEIDPLATQPGGYLLSIPGVANDFVLGADGQFEQRANGTARLTAFLRRAASIDREFFMQLEFSGRLDPSSVGYPPAGSPVVLLQPAAYIPSGPIDPGTFVYYTQVTGSLTGVHSYGGALVTATQASPAQLGIGANNRNLLNGLSLDLTLQVVTPPALLPFTPTGPTEVRATLTPSLPVCATHVDPDPAASGSTARTAVVIPGVASDYVFLPVGQFVEAANGSATLHGFVRRQSDYQDVWQYHFVLGGRVDPQHPAYPPGAGPVLQLLVTSYASHNPPGPIDPAQWRYYTQVTGSLSGSGINLGGFVTVAAAAPVQVGLGAGQGNESFGLMASLTPTIVTQPTARTLTLLGPIAVQANLDTGCLLPTPTVLTGLVQTLDNVTELPAIYTGTDLGWIEQVAFGTTIIASTDPRRWYHGNFQIRDHQTIEVFLPQGMPPGPYALSLLDHSGGVGPMTLNLQEPTVPTLRTETAVFIGEAQHWIAHQGNLQGPVLTYIMLSSSNTPSILPGYLSLSIGNAFNDLFLFPGSLNDFSTHMLLVTVPSMPPLFTGHIHLQAAMVALASANMLPLPTTNTWFTDY